MKFYVIALSTLVFAGSFAQAAEKLKLHLKIGITVCQLNADDSIAGCTFQHNSVEESVVQDIERQGAPGDFLQTAIGYFAKDFTLVNPIDQSPIALSVFLGGGSMAIESEISYHVEGQVSPLGGDRLDTRISYVSVKDLAAIDTVFVNGKEIFTTDANGVKFELTPTLYISDVQIVDEP